MKTYSLRLTVKITANSDIDAERVAKYYLKELPKMNESTVSNVSLYDLTDKKTVFEERRD